MPDNRHLSSVTVALLIVIVFTSAFEVYAVAKPSPTPGFARVSGCFLCIDPDISICPAPEQASTEAFTPLVTLSTVNLSAAGSIQRPSSVNSLALEPSDQNPSVAFELFPQNLSVTVGDAFAVTVAVKNVTDLYAWQVYACFDQTVLQCLGVTLPFNNIFQNSLATSGLLKDYNATEFPQPPLQNVQNDGGWVLAGDCLVGTNQTTFNGSGILCQLEFKAVSPGSTILGLLQDSDHDFQTYILTSGPDVTPQSATYSYINVASS